MQFGDLQKKSLVANLTFHKYRISFLLTNYIKASIGIFVSVFPIFILEAAGIIKYFFVLIFAIFILLLIKTIFNQLVTVFISNDSIEIIEFFIKKRKIKWDKVNNFELQYYSTRQDKEKGWMQLKVSDKKNTITIHSAISNFEVIAKKTAYVASKNDITLTNRTVINYKAIGINVYTK